MDGWMDASGWMDGWMDACMHVCMYGPVSRVPESMSLGDHTIGGGPRDPESGLICHIYIYIKYIWRLYKLVSSTIFLLCFPITYLEEVEGYDRSYGAQ